MVVVWLPGALQKCVFDEVQAQVRVVRAADITHPDSPPTDGRVPLISEQPARHPGRRPASLWGLMVKLRSRVEERAPPTPASPQPIRIHSWITRESDDLSDAEKYKLEAAVEEAVRVVSSLLSGKKHTTQANVVV